MIVVLLLWLKLVGGERTVLVTPRPRWLPNKFAYEPKGDPSNPAIPPIVPIRRPVYNLRIIPSGPNSLLSATLPVEHRNQQKGQEVFVEPVPLRGLAVPLVAKGPGSMLSKPIVVSPQKSAPLQPIVVSPQQSASSYSHQPIVVGPATFQQPDGKEVYSQPDRPRQDNRNHVYVESVPSLSVKLEENPQIPDELPDYLTPPRYPSVYENQLLEPNDSSKSPKRKKKNKKKKQKPEDSKGKDEGLTDSKNHKFRTQSSGERVEFQLHGQNGPDSYKFGFDTGAGKNRQFRYEEKDSAGNVKGRFGYYDTTGKLQVFNYRADETGYHAEQVDGLHDT